MYFGSRARFAFFFCTLVNLARYKQGLTEGLKMLCSEVYNTGMNEFSECPTDGDIGLMILLVTAGRSSESCLDHALSAANLTFTKWRTLDLLYRAGTPVSMRALVEKLGCAKSNVTPLVDKLEAAGYVRRMADQVDRRSILVELTEDGHSLHKEGKTELDAATKLLFAKLGHDGKSALRRHLGQIDADRLTERLQDRREQ
jgi:DNA-binding MarR family transcriptional regulator